MKKLFFLLVTAALAIMTVTPAFAHSHGSGHSVSHYYGDGHDYHEYCDVADCGLTVYHKHDGIYYLGHTDSDGHDSHPAPHEGGLHR